METKAYFHKDVATGLWKFAGVPERDLIELAKKLKTEEGSKYLDMYVRKCSKTQRGIGFMYTLAGESFDDFFYRMTDLMKRTFGNGFVGWDISPATWIIQ